MRKRNKDNTVREDHFLNPELRKYTEEFFGKFGLPMPTSDMIYRGNSQDLLFLGQYGLVIRTGPMDIVDMIHPAVLQPLYWLPFNNNKHVIAIYPGIQISNHLHDGERQNFDVDRHKLTQFMQKTGQSTIDSSFDENFGYINGQLVVLDTENFYFGSKNDQITAVKSGIFNTYSESAAPHIAARMLMSELYEPNNPREFQRTIATFDAHQPLRAQIHDALNAPNAEIR